MRLILKVRDRGLTVKSSRYIYTVEDDKGNVLATRRSDRKYVACLAINHGSGYAVNNYFGRRDIIHSGWNASTFRWLNQEKKEYQIVYTKKEIEDMINEQYDNYGIQEALNEADKHATIIDKYCSHCDNYYPAFKDEDYCLICGCAHTKKKDPDLQIPLENKI